MHRLLICLLPALILPACSGKKSVDKDALAKYTAALEALRKTDLEETAISAFRAVSGKNRLKDKALYQALERCTLPNYSMFYSRLNAIQPEDSRLSNLHHIYREGARYQLLAFSNVSEYLVSRDKADLRRFQEQGRHARNLIDRWKNGFNKLITAAGKR